MRTILKSILLMSLYSSATAPAMAINGADNNKEKSSIHGMETSDSIKHQPLTESSVKLNEVVVTGLTGSQKLKQSPAPISFVSARQLEMQPSTNIIDAIAHQPGVSQITTGSGISKPVIRGLGFNRVVVVNDGVRQEGQQWGDEHGIEIDPASVHSVEILKGPASLMYGSDANVPGDNSNRGAAKGPVLGVKNRRRNHRICSCRHAPFFHYIGYSRQNRPGCPQS
jgi:iron complex outermembrane recepter protein